MYGISEETIGKWFKRTGKRGDIFLATKFGFHSAGGKVTVKGDPEYAQMCLQNSMKNLGVDQIDLYYLHRCAAIILYEHYVEFVL
jgi:aryl-alcohol dehydrogenase-like predicted oxidoreductase